MPNHSLYRESLERLPCVPLRNVEHLDAENAAALIQVEDDTVLHLTTPMYPTAFQRQVERVCLGIDLDLHTCARTAPWR